MNIQQFCDYLNEIGIIDIENIKHFLQISTYMINNNNQNNTNKSINDIYKIALFSYIREINVDDKNLYSTCSNVINSYKRYIILKKYNSLFLFKNLIYIKIYQRFKSFLVSLYKKFPFKSYHINKYHENKKKKIKNRTNINKFNSINNNEINNEQNINQNKKYNQKDNSDINNNIITFKKQENYNILGFENYKYIKELIPAKKLKIIDNNICINQSNLNFEKFFINKKLVICKRNNNYLSYIERIQSNKKYLYNNNPYEYSYSSFTLRKNKSETKLRIKKMNYEENTRSKNFETLQPKVKRKIKERAKSKKEEELLKKQKEDDIYNKLIEKEIDKQNLIDRLYREVIINQKKEERKQKKEINKLKKSPIDWEKLYLNTNNRIIKNKKEKNINKSYSYFIPKKGRIYKYTNTIEYDNNIQNNINSLIMNNNKDNKTIETSINRDKERSLKISLELNSPNKNPNSNSNNAFEIKESELNSINSEKEENKSLEKDIIEEKKENNEKINDEIKISTISDDNINYELLKEKLNQQSLSKFQSKGIQDILNKKNLNKNKKNSEFHFKYSENDDKEEEVKKEKERDKTDFNDLLISNNYADNII